MPTALAQLKVSKNITNILLPSRSPELNPVENIWQYMRQNWFSNRVFETYDAILNAGCEAWNKLFKQTEPPLFTLTCSQSGSGTIESTP